MLIVFFFVSFRSVRTKIVKRERIASVNPCVYMQRTPFRQQNILCVFQNLISGNKHEKKESEVLSIYDSAKQKCCVYLKAFFVPAQTEQYGLTCL